MYLFGQPPPEAFNISRKTFDTIIAIIPVMAKISRIMDTNAPTLKKEARISDEGSKSSVFGLVTSFFLFFFSPFGQSIRKSFI